MRHGRRTGRLGLVQEHRTSLLRNLARNLIQNQQIVTTHARAKEASRFVDQLVTIAKQNTLHARRHLISKLGSSSEELASQLISTIAPKFSTRKGGYTRVLRYKERAGDGASLSILEFTVPVIEIPEKKPKKKKVAKPEVHKEHKEKDHAHKETKEKKKDDHDKPKASKEETKKKTEEIKKETPKKGGFLGSLRRFLKGDDEGKK